MESDDWLFTYQPRLFELLCRALSKKIESNGATKLHQRIQTDTPSTHVRPPAGVEKAKDDIRKFDE